MAQLISNSQDSSGLQKMLTPHMVKSQAYQDGSNMFTSSEQLQSTNRFQINFNSLQLGARGVQFSIPNNDIITEVVLTMGFAQMPVDVRMVRGWGIRLIENLTIYVAGASPYRMSHYELFSQAMRQCDTQAKGDQYLKMAGLEVSDGPNEGKPIARIVLPLPWSSLRHLQEHIGLDSALLSQPIRISIDIANASELFYGIGAVNAPKSLIIGYMQVRQEVFKDSSEMVIREGLRRNPESFYNYRFYYHQPFTSAEFTGATDPTNQVTVSLNGFRNANLQSITLLLEDIADSPCNSLQYYSMTNLVLNYNGVDLFRSNDGDSSPWCMVDSLSGKCAVGNEYVPALQTNTPFVGGPTNSVWTSILMVPRDEVSFSNLIQSGLAVPNQTLTLTFNTPEGVNTTYRCHATFSYAASYLINQSNAEIMY